MCTLSWFLEDWKHGCTEKTFHLQRNDLQVLQVSACAVASGQRPPGTFQTKIKIYIHPPSPSVHVCPKFSWPPVRPSVCPSHQGCHRCQRRVPHQSLSAVKHPIRGTLPVSRPIQLMGGFFIFLFNRTRARPTILPGVSDVLSLQGQVTPYRRPGNTLSRRHVRLYSRVSE